MIGGVDLLGGSYGTSGLGDYGMSAWSSVYVSMGKEIWAYDGKVALNNIICQGWRQIKPGALRI
jgi:hypothetical protein